MGKKYLILILVLATVLRLVKIDQSFWLDEASQAQLSSLSVHQIWFERGGDFHPPLFYILAHFWLQLGHSETWLRLLPISFGIANVYLLYLFAKKLKLNANLAALLLAIAPFHIYYSQEFRSYSMLCLLGTLSMYLLYQKKYLLTSIVNAVMFYTHYSAFFLVTTQFLLDPKIIFYSPVTAALYLPWLPQFVQQLSSGVNIDSYLPGWRDILSVSPLKTFPLTVFKIVAGRITFISRPIYSVYFGFVVIVTLVASWLASQHRRFLYSWVFTPIFLMLITSFFIPQSQPFRLIYILPAFILLFVQACTKSPKLFLTLFIYIALTGNIIYFTRPRLQREQWRQAIDFVARQEAQTVIKFSAPFSPFVWYRPDLKIIPAVPTFPAKPEEVAQSMISLSTRNRVLLFDYLGDLTDPSRTVDLTLENLGFTQGQIYDFSGIGFIREYRK